MSFTTTDEKSVKDKLLEVRDGYKKRGSFGDEELQVRNNFNTLE